MNSIKTVSDYIKMPAGKKKKFLKVVLKKSNKDQAALVDRYDKAVARGELKPV